MPGQRRRPTTHDVARAAGVSAATVSYVLNDTPGRRIGVETRERVQNAADALGYRPQLAGRTLRTGRSDVIVLMLPDWPIGATLLGIMDGLARALEPIGFALAVVPQSKTNTLEHVAQSLAPAAIITFDDPGAAFREPRGVPVLVAIGDHVGTFGGQRYALQSHLAEMQIAHLADHGHERIGYVRNANTRLQLFVRARLDGAAAAMVARGLQPLVVREIDDTLEQATTALRELRDAGVTAIAAYNDDTALPLLAAAQRLGIKVPGEIAVIGVDAIPAGAYALPPLTSVRQDLEHAMQHWLQAIQAVINHETPQLDGFTGSAFLVERESV